MRARLLKQINCYLDGGCSLNDLQTWLLSNLQTILDSGDQNAIKLANQLDVDLVHLGEGLTNELEIWERLAGAVRENETQHMEAFGITRSEPSRTETESHTFRERIEDPKRLLKLHVHFP